MDNPLVDEVVNEDLASPLVLPVVGGRLMAFTGFWDTHIRNRWAREIVRQGYSLDFLHPIPKLTTRVKVTIVPLLQRHFLLEEIDAMLEKDAIEKVEDNSLGFYSTFFIVAKKGGGFRPILNLRPLNKHICYRRFRMETLTSVLENVFPGDWMASLDLKDAYFHVPILPSHRPFLRFAFANVIYQFKVLPFGLSSAPRVFTKILAPLVAHIHLQGIHFIPYLDDCLIIAKSKKDLVMHVQEAVRLLERAGFIINLKKSHMDPSQDLIFLGMRLRTDLGLVQLAPERVGVLIECLSQFRLHRYVSAKLFQRLLGLMAACLLMVPTARLLMRPVQMFLIQRWNPHYQSQDYLVLVTKQLQLLLKPWRDPLFLQEGVLLQAPAPLLTVTTDASKLGWGGHCQDLKVQGVWSKRLRRLHINLLEMLAVQLVFRSFQSVLTGKSVLLRTDNTSVLNYVNKVGGTRSRNLCSLALQLLRWCHDHQVSVTAIHLAGEKNCLADSLSRHFVSQTEWELDRAVVRRLFLLWTHPTMDLFANEHNHQTLVYCSWRPDPQAYQLDAMTMSWRGLFAYAFPPLALIQKVLLKVKRDQSELILVAPNWPNRAWFPHLLGVLVDHPRRIPMTPQLLTQQHGTLLHSNPVGWSLVAWRISGNILLHRAYLQRLHTQSFQPGLQGRTGHMKVVGEVSLPGAEVRVSIPLIPL